MTLQAVCRGRCAELVGYWQYLGVDKISMSEAYYKAMKQMEGMIGRFNGLVTQPRIADVYEALCNFLGVSGSKDFTPKKYLLFMESSSHRGAELKHESYHFGGESQRESYQLGGASDSDPVTPVVVVTKWKSPSGPKIKVRAMTFDAFRVIGEDWLVRENMGMVYLN